MRFDNCWVPQVETDEKEAVGSKYFGRPWLADNEQWPEKNGDKLLFVMQLEISSLPEPIKNLLGGTGVFQLFYPANPSGLNTWEGDGIVARIVFPDRISGKSVEVPPETVEQVKQGNLDDPWITRSIVGWKEMPDEPHYEDRQETNEDENENENDDDSSYYEDEDESKCVQGDKLGGWPYWTQAGERLIYRSNGKIDMLYNGGAGEEMIPFLQLDAGCFFDGVATKAYAPGLFAGDGTLHVSVLPSNPQILAVRWACG